SLLIVVLFLYLPSLLSAPIQQAWSIRYHGASLSTNIPVAMTLDPAGNIILAGSSTGPNGDYDYVTMKYSTNGTLLWLRRYSSAVSAKDQVQAMAVDKD